jgi:FtsZ-binding cell division protein ZapB
VQTLLEDFEWGELSVNEMARICGVSPQLVTAVKLEMEGGAKVSTVKTNAPKKPVKLETVVEAPLNLTEEKDEAVAELVAENQRLSDRLAVEAMDASEEEKLAASETIAELREQIRILEIENQSLKISRDTFQRENGELKKTVASLQRKLKKEEA